MERLGEVVRHLGPFVDDVHDRRSRVLAIVDEFLPDFVGLLVLSGKGEPDQTSEPIERWLRDAEVEHQGAAVVLTLLTTDGRVRERGSLPALLDQVNAALDA